MTAPKSLSDRTLLVIGLWHREFAMATLLRSGYRLIVVDEPGSFALPMADKAMTVDLYDLEHVAWAVAGVIEQRHVSGVLTFWDALVPTTHRIARDAGLPALSARAAEAGLDKRVMRRRLAAAGVPQPQYRLCSTAQGALAAGEVLGYPLVVKPANLSGSEGVTKVDDAAAISQAFHRARLSSPRIAEVLVEEWIDGTEVDVDAIVRGGTVAVISAMSTNSIVHQARPLWSEMTAPYPVTPSLEDIVTRALAALEMDDCLVMVQVYVSADGVHLAEVNARVAGGPGPEMTALACGVNVYELAASLAVGERPTYLVQDRQFVSAANILSPPGRPASVQDLRAAQSHPEVRQVIFHPDSSWQETAFGERQVIERGYAIGVGDTASGSLEAAVAARNSLTVLVDPTR